MLFHCINLCKINLLLNSLAYTPKRSSDFAHLHYKNPIQHQDIYRRKNPARNPRSPKTTPLHIQIYTMSSSVIPRILLRRSLANQGLFRKPNVLQIPKFYQRASQSTKTEVPRDDLTSRVLPQMVLSKGDASSLTPPPQVIPASVSAEERARLRFLVEGNAM